MQIFSIFVGVITTGYYQLLVAIHKNGSWVFALEAQPHHKKVKMLATEK